MLSEISQLPYLLKVPQLDPKSLSLTGPSCTMAVPVDIPFFYRFMFLWFEPFWAFNGAIMSALLPELYLKTMAPHATYNPQYQVLLDQVAALYLLFAFNEAVVLRITGDVKVWKAILAGIVVCDVIHIYGTARALGPTMFLHPITWRSYDWFNICFLLGMAPVRLGLIFEVGFPGKPESLKRA